MARKKKDEKAVTEEHPTEVPEQTDNEPRPEDGLQDLSQDPDVFYESEVSEDD